LKAEPKTMPDIHKASLLRDETSQILALSDALSSAHGAAISAAFDDVARTCGLTKIARDANVEMGDLYRAFANPARPDTGLLTEVMAALIRMHPVLDSAQASPDGADEG
jgi:DNA-binding phage protein